MQIKNAVERVSWSSTVQECISYVAHVPAEISGLTWSCRVVRGGGLFVLGSPVGWWYRGES